jgi:hypothetical protein
VLGGAEDLEVGVNFGAKNLKFPQNIQANIKNISELGFFFNSSQQNCLTLINELLSLNIFHSLAGVFIRLTKTSKFWNVLNI